MFLMANIVVGLLCNKKFGEKMRDFKNCELNNVKLKVAHQLSLFLHAPVLHKSPSLFLFK